MKVYIGADHRGLKLKEEIKEWFSENNILAEDLGALSYDQNDDYPIYAQKVARQVSQGIEKKLDSKGIVICGSGVGVDIVANKFNHIRCGFAVSAEQVGEARRDDDINMLAIPSDFVNGETAKTIVKIFLETKFSKEGKKIRRLKEIDKIEHGI